MKSDEKPFFCQIHEICFCFVLFLGVVQVVIVGISEGF